MLNFEVVCLSLFPQFLSYSSHMVLRSDCSILMTSPIVLKKIDHFGYVGEIGLLIGP